MAEHLSRLELDEWLSGLDPTGRMGAHVASCGTCGPVAEELRRARESSLRAPRAETVFAKLEAKRAQPARTRWSWGGPLVVALAVGLTLVVYVPKGTEDGVRLKGSVALRLLSEGGAPVTNARPGERVTLAVGTGTHRDVLVLAVDEAGAVDVLWPQGGRTSGKVEPGAEVKLSPPLEVTPGSVALHAFFSDTPLLADEAKAGLLARIVEARARGRGPLDAVTPEGLGKASAHAVLRVAP
ncbi:hypothetical protein OV207_16180 [Corallococcus sp. BB11-1]|uniref:hypothetical protein n=1 Tax=Corallococcus sp. BB11-1 TaxID=2996783 RepID=UPI002271AEA2|nr:hypothetical protein [Corallococcus sp. BB11-1]MCY1033010.1 hypothetical protein [Corallococcus sp. BB11-1]